VRALPLSRVDSLIDDILDISDLANIRCDPWQEGALEAIASIDADGQWAATEFGVLVSRQQGKGNILLPYELAHLFLWPRADGAPKLIGHTAHEGPTAREAFRRARRTILASPILRAELVGGGKQTAQGVTGISTGNGNWAIELKNGNRLVFFTRTGAAGVGISFDVLIVDEAQHSPLSILEALLPASDASPNLQVLFTGTVPKEDQDGEYFEGIRDRGRAGGQERTGWIEHTPEGSDDPDTAAKIDLGSPQTWREANPGLGTPGTAWARRTRRRSLVSVARSGRAGAPRSRRSCPSSTSRCGSGTPETTPQSPATAWCCRSRWAEVAGTARLVPPCESTPTRSLSSTCTPRAAHGGSRRS
jgi:hypothetical protein